jgi:hypothetical protein
VANDPDDYGYEYGDYGAEYGAEGYGQEVPPPQPSPPKKKEPVKEKTDWGEESNQAQQLMSSIKTKTEVTKFDALDLESTKKQQQPKA